jgi:hypothetical protein
MTLRMDHASFVPQALLSQLILDVDLGIGITKFASNAPKDGSLTRIRFAFLLAINAIFGTHKVNVLLASKAMSLRMDHVSFVPQALLSQQMQDALNGTGIIKFA